MPNSAFFDIEVLQCEYSEESHSVIEVTEIRNEKHVPIGTRKNGSLSLKRLNYWYVRRAIPGYRVGLNTLLSRLSVSSPMDLVEFTHAVSVSDTYWIKKENEELSWDEVSFFRHSFDQEGFARAIFSPINNKAPDSARLTPNNNTAGFHRKAWMKRNGSLSLLKGGYPFYQMEPVNEWLAGMVADNIGADCLPYTTEVYENNLVSVCAAFTDEHTDLVTAEMILMEYGITDQEAKSYIRIGKEHGITDSQERFSDQCLLDYLLLNTDRHAQNMGVLVDADTMEWKQNAPVFDTGTALACLVEDSAILDEARYQECTLFAKRKQSSDILLPYIDLSRYDFSHVLDLPREYGNMLVRYQPVTHISDNRIEAAYTLFYKQLLKIRKYQRQAR